MRYKALPASVRSGARPRFEAAPDPAVQSHDRVSGWLQAAIVLALVPAILLPIVLAHAGAASLTITPSSTAPGTSVTVRGDGFAPNSRGTIRLDALKSSQTTYRADGAGTFRVAFQVPASTQLGAHTLSAINPSKGRGSSTTLASAELMVARQATVSPTPLPSAQATALASPSASAAMSATPSPTPAASVQSSPSLTPTPTASPSAAPSTPGLPIRAAFYYPWFPEAWKQQGMDPFTHYHPTLGYYDGSSTTVIRSQIAAMQYAHISAGIASWWGIGTNTDQRIPLLLQAASGSGFRWAVYYEAEGWGNPSVAQITADLTYIAANLASNPSYLRIDGKFVVFVYGDAGDSCATADRWRLANTVGAYVVLKVFSGYRTCASQPNGWHQYGPAAATDSQPGYSFSISPGFFKANEAAPRLARDINRWYDDVRQMIASGAPFQLITTFNEWGEGTSVESATEWQSASGYGAFLDALHANGVP